MRRRGTLALSWGPWGGFYVTRSRVCLGFIAVTLLRKHEIDDLMEGYVERDELRAQLTKSERETARERTWRHEAVDYERAHGRLPLTDLLSAAKQWRQATESRLRLVSNREMSDVLLPPDQALFEAIDKAEGEVVKHPMLNGPGWDFETCPPTGRSRARDRRSWRREYEQEAAQDDEEFAAEMEHFFGDDQLEEGAR